MPNPDPYSDSHGNCDSNRNSHGNCDSYGNCDADAADANADSDRDANTLGDPASANTKAAAYAVSSSDAVRVVKRLKS